ncbi:MAG: hypothetical protein LBD41_00135 [Clostridiales Family XIII bacterium]|jgi:archaellum component FlaF (FlaF/FlaG flagellin family)|nr:hypothetical protein [Clostridiales Family XIII bacterium]
MKNLKGHRGFFIIEAAITFPIIIFSALLVLFLAINYYSDLSYNIKMQEAANKYVDKKIGNIETEIKKKSISKLSDNIFSKKISINYSKDYAKASMKRNYFLPRYFGVDFNEKNVVRTYAIEETA